MGHYIYNVSRPKQGYQWKPRPCKVPYRQNRAATGRCLCCHLLALQGNIREENSEDVVFELCFCWSPETLLNEARAREARRCFVRALESLPRKKGAGTQESLFER